MSPYVDIAVPVQLVAVKVRHPHVAQRLNTDFAIMCFLARLAAKLPILRDLRFDDTVLMFGVPLHQQLDLQLEAEHLDRFRYNFRCDAMRHEDTILQALILLGMAHHISRATRILVPHGMDPSMQPWC